MLSRHQQTRVKQEVGELVAPVVDEVFLVAGQADRRDLLGVEARSARQYASHVQIEVARRGRRRVDIRNQAARPEAILRNDRDRVRQNRTGRDIQRARNFHDRGCRQVGDRLAVFPLGLVGHIHRECVAVRALHRERVRRRRRYSSNEIVDVRVGIGRGNCLDRDHRIYCARDIAASIHGDRVLQVEVKRQADDRARANRQRVGEVHRSR